MLRRFLIFGILCLFSFNLFSEENPNKEGYALLDLIVTAFRDMAMTGTGGFERVDKAIQGMMAEVKKAREEKKIDAVFFKRYTRLLSFIKLSLIPDPQSILQPVIKKEIGEFIEETLGEEWDGKSIGQMAQAIAEEIINLHIYLETIGRKAELMKIYEQKSAVKKIPGS